MGKYTKAIVGTLGAVATLAITLLDDGHMSNSEWVVLASGVVTAIGVWWFPNDVSVTSDKGVRKEGW